MKLEINQSTADQVKTNEALDHLNESLKINQNNYKKANEYIQKITDALKKQGSKVENNSLVKIMEEEIGFLEEQNTAICCERTEYLREKYISEVKEILSEQKKLTERYSEVFFGIEIDSDRDSILATMNSVSDEIINEWDVYF